LGKNQPFEVFPDLLYYFFMKVLSSGFLIVSPSGLLLARATSTARWDIPKGRLDGEETPLEAAVRETYEETGIDVSERAREAVDLGQRSYIKNKNLHLFRLDYPEAFDLGDCKCSTFFERPTGKVDENGNPLMRKIPETDKWEWVPFENVKNYIGKGLLATLNDLDFGGAIGFLGGVAPKNNRDPLGFK